MLLFELLSFATGGKRHPLRAAAAVLTAAFSLGAAADAFAATASIGPSSSISQQIFQPASSSTDDSNTALSGEVDAELVFNRDVVSARSVASFARSGQSIDIADTDGAGLIVPA